MKVKILLSLDKVMASRPSNISRRRSNMTGCMGGFVHLFDFNQALAGKKLLTNNKYGSEGNKPFFLYHEFAIIYFSFSVSFTFISMLTP